MKGDQSTPSSSAFSSQLHRISLSRTKTAVSARVISKPQMSQICILNLMPFLSHFSLLFKPISFSIFNQLRIVYIISLTGHCSCSSLCSKLRVHMPLYHFTPPLDNTPAGKGSNNHLIRKKLSRDSVTLTKDQTSLLVSRFKRLI